MNPYILLGIAIPVTLIIAVLGIFLRRKMIGTNIRWTKSFYGEENLKKMREFSGMATKDDIEELKKQIADLRDAIEK